jgi:hypothetical protein
LTNRGEGWVDAATAACAAADAAGFRNDDDGSRGALDRRRAADAVGRRNADIFEDHRQR